MSEAKSISDPPSGFENGLTVEHVLLSVTIVSTNKLIQYDDSCARMLELNLMEYCGVKNVNAQALYSHGKTEHHSNGCQCGYCVRPPFKLSSPK